MATQTIEGFYKGMNEKDIDTLLHLFQVPSDNFEDGESADSEVQKELLREEMDESLENLVEVKFDIVELEVVENNSVVAMVEQDSTFTGDDLSFDAFYEFYISKEDGEYIITDYQER